MDNLENLKDTPLVRQFNYLVELEYNCEIRPYADNIRLFTYLGAHIVIQKYTKTGLYVEMKIARCKSHGKK